MLSPVPLSSVCLAADVTLVRLLRAGRTSVTDRQSDDRRTGDSTVANVTQPVEIFGNVSTPSEFDTLAIR